MVSGVNLVCICGGGHQGLSMAAHLAINGVYVSLWNRTEKNIQKIIDTKEIICTGAVSGIARVEKAGSCHDVWKKLELCSTVFLFSGIFSYVPIFDKDGWKKNNECFI